MSVTVAQLLKGYGPKCPPLHDLLALTPDEAKIISLSQPTPALGRYINSVGFLSGVTSQKVVALVRFRVLIEYLIALSEELDGYDGKHKLRKIVHSLTPEDKADIRSLANTLSDIIRAEALERCTDHDTAAAAGWLKVLIGTRYPRLEWMIEAVAFACTSEDTMSSVFGMVGNSLIYGHFVPMVLDLMESLLDFVDDVEQDGPFIIPAETHRQVAEPQTMGKRITTDLMPMDFRIRRLHDGDRFMAFPAHIGGATGNLVTHYAAYPDIDWRSFGRGFVEGLGMTYEEMTFQSGTYAIETAILSELGGLLTHLIKFCEDFLSMAACPAQLILKRRQAGLLGSSVMPQKFNWWGVEGAKRMLEETREMLSFYARALPDFPREGDMGRSYLMRNIGTVMMPAVIAIGRISSEIVGDLSTRGARVSRENAKFYLDRYQTISASAIQTVLKREGIEGDAYRQIQAICITPDGDYVNARQFARGLGRIMKENRLPRRVCKELRLLTKPENNIGDADVLAKRSSATLRANIAVYRQQLIPFAKPLIPEVVPIA